MRHLRLLRNKQIKRIIINGYFGYRSLGDEAILSGMINAFREQINNCKIIVFSNHPSVIEKLHNVSSVRDFPIGIRSFLFWIFSGELINTIRELVNADLFVFGGGGGLSDEQRWQNIPESFIKIILAKLFRLPMITYSLGAGPIKTKLGKLLTKIAFDKFNIITVRDQESKKWLIDTGLKKEIILTADPGVLIQPDAKVNLRNLAGKSIHNYSKRYKIGLAPAAMFFSKNIWPGRQKDYTRLLNSFAKIGDFVNEKLNSDVFLFQVSPNVDTDFCMKIQQKMKNKSHLLFPGYNHLEIAGAFAQMDMIIGSRFHSVVLSTMVGVPFVAIIYHHKTKCFLEQIRQLHRSVPLEFNLEDLFQVIVDTWNKREEMKKELAMITPELRRGAKFPSIMASKLLE